MLQRVLETAPMAIVLFDMPSKRVMQLNQMAEAFLGLPADALQGHAPADWPQWMGGLTAAELAELELNLQLASESPHGVRREVERPGLEGEARIWDVRWVAVEPGPESTDAPVLMVASEVTDWRQAEQERFDAAIAQRGMLVQEVHHRIKNNLQGVAGLLQQASARFPEVAPILSEAVGQLQAIAQVYGLQVGATGPVPLWGLVQSVAASVQKTFAHEIEVLDTGPLARDWRLPEAESIPVALTLNELLTNAHKHGAAERPLQCELVSHDHEVHLNIRNTGALAPGFDMNLVPPGASGLGLVRALLPRRAAALSLSQEGDQVCARVTLRPPAVRLPETKSST